MCGVWAKRLGGGLGQNKGNNMSNLTEQELRDMTNIHLRYECDMLVAMSDKNSDDVALNNAYIESFCVHARNLIEFLAREKKTI